MEKKPKCHDPARQNCQHVPWKVKFLHKDLIYFGRWTCQLLEKYKNTPLLSHKEDKNIFPLRLTRCWIFLRVPTTFPCHSDKMLCPTLLVYPLLFPPLPWSTSGGPAACFTDVSSTQLLSCFSNGFLQQMIPCVYAPSFLLTPFLSIKTICCCFRSRETPSHTTDAVFFRLWHWYTWSAGNTSLLSVPHD